MSRIIIVDDDRDIRIALEDVLRTEGGHEVESAPSGLKLLSMLAMGQPDLIILDVMMSWIDGIGLCRALKQNQKYTNIPIIFISARVTATDIKRGLDAGAADYLTKPVDMSRILTSVSRVLVR